MFLAPFYDEHHLPGQITPDRPASLDGSKRHLMLVGFVWSDICICTGRA